MLHTVHFNYLDILKFSMIVEAETHEQVFKILKQAINDDRVFSFSPNSSVKLGYLQVKDIQSYFTIEKTEPRPTSAYSIIYDNDQDDIPTKPDIPNLFKR